MLPDLTSSFHINLSRSTDAWFDAPRRKKRTGAFICPPNVILRKQFWSKCHFSFGRYITATEAWTTDISPNLAENVPGAFEGLSNAFPWFPRDTLPNDFRNMTSFVGNIAVWWSLGIFPRWLQFWCNWEKFKTILKDLWRAPHCFFRLTLRPMRGDLAQVAIVAALHFFLLMPKSVM